MRRIDEHLVRWAMHKFKRLRRRPAQAQKTLDAAQQRQPTLFAHWQLVSPDAGLWEPYDGRLSRTVLREREGEVPSRHSPKVLGARSAVQVLCLTETSTGTSGVYPAPGGSGRDFW